MAHRTVLIIRIVLHIHVHEGTVCAAEPAASKHHKTLSIYIELEKGVVANITPLLSTFLV